MQLRRGLMQLCHSVTASHRADIFLKVLTLSMRFLELLLAISSTFPRDFLNFSWRFPELFYVIFSASARDFQREF